MDIDAHFSWRRDMALLLISLMLLFGIGLGAHAYLTPSEARYIELPRQMLATGDFLTPRLNGVPYFEKPPLFYWMQAGAMALFGNPTGDNEFAGRIVTALLMAGTCLMVYGLGRMLFGRLSGVLSAGVLATSLMGYGLSRIAMLDVPVTFFITATLGCFLAAQYHHAPRRFYYLMYICAALAVMTKGLIGAVIPGMVIGTWIVALRRWDILRTAHLFTGAIIFLIVTVPWHVLMARVHPDFLNFYFIHEHFERFLTDEARRGKPWWFFTAVTLVGLLPWTGLLPGAARRLSFQHPTQLFLILWIVLPFVFFSTSKSQLLPYIFPIFPPLAMIFGDYLAQLWEEKRAPRSLQWACYLALLVFGAGIIFCIALPYFADRYESKFTLPEHIPLEFVLPLIAGWLAVAVSLFTHQPLRTRILALAASGIITGMVINYMAARFDSASTKPLAEMLKPRLQSGDTVVSYDTYFQDLPIYLGQNIVVSGWHGELDFGITHYPETQEWMIGDDTFWTRCAQTQRFFVFAKRSTYESLPIHADCPLELIGGYGRNVLLQKEMP